MEGTTRSADDVERRRRQGVLATGSANGGGNGAGCFEVETWEDTAKFTNVILAGLIKCGDLV